MEISNLSKVTQLLSANASIWGGEVCFLENSTLPTAVLFSSSKDIRIRCSEHKTVRK